MMMDWLMHTSQGHGLLDRDLQGYFRRCAEEGCQVRCR